MLDENIDNLQSEDLSNNSTSNSNLEDNSSKLTEETSHATNLEETISETKPVSEELIKVEETENKKEEIKELEDVVEEPNTGKEKTVEKEEAHLDKIIEEVVEVNQVEEDIPIEKTTGAVVDDKEGREDNHVKEASEETIVKEEREAVTIEEITEETVAVKNEKKDVHVEKTTKEVIEKVDYSSLDLEGLVTEFQKLLRQDTVEVIKNSIETIKLTFNKKYGELLQEKKKEFLAGGGNEIDFHYSNPIKSRYNELLFEFKTKRENYYKQIEEEQKENLSKRLVLIEDLKHLIDNAEPSTMYNQFRDLQQKWRAIGKIPRAKYNDIWRTYHHHVERFYDLLHLSNDFRELDFKHNLEEKLKLVDKAEALAEQKDLNKAFKELQILHKLWKEDIGPVAREHREEIWERFSNATKKIHEQRHKHQKKLESKYEDNVVLKRELIDKIRNLVTDKIDSHKIWQQKIKELEAIRQDFFKIGRVPKALNEKVWGEFKEATRTFNRIKNSFYKDVKRNQHENLKKKNALVERAESLKDSDDWDMATEVMKQIQAEWKTIGHVPRKYSDKVWKRFKDACNHYFDRLHGVQDEANKDQVEAFNKKKELLENLKSQSVKDEALTLEVINSYIDDWYNLGSLPSNMRHIETKFNKVLDSLYAKLNLDEKEVAMLKFKNNIRNSLSNNNLRKLDNEQLFVRKKIDEVTREIQQLENNISFISSATDDNPLLKNVRKNIENYNKQLDIWKTKLAYITSLNY